MTSSLFNPFKKDGIISAKDMLQLLTVVLLWAICYPLITSGLAAFSPFQFATLRSLIAGFSLLFVGYMLKRPILPEKSLWPNLAIISLTFTALGFTGMFLAGGRITPGLATVIANVQPLLAALLGLFYLTERLNRRTGLALFVGFAGILVIAHPGLTESSSNSTPSGIALVLIGAIGVAVGNVLLKSIANRVDPLIAMAWVLLLGAIPLAIAAAVYESTNTIKWSLASVSNLLILSIFGTALVFYWWLKLLQKIPLNVLNAFTFLTPVLALFMGIAFYNERLILIEWLGMGIIVFSLYLASHKKTK